MTVLSLTSAVSQSLRAHAERAYPCESCGVLLGQPISPGSGGWRISDAVPATNAEPSSPRSRFSIAPSELVRIMREARGRGLEVAGFYHSHPDHPAHWSLTDLAEAHWLGCCYVITSVGRGLAQETRAFLLAGTTEEDKRFETQEICVEDS